MRQFRPCKVEIKGWVQQWRKRFEQALNRTEVGQCLEQILGKLSNEIKELIDIDKTTKGLDGRKSFFKADVSIKGGRESCFPGGLADPSV